MMRRSPKETARERILTDDADGAVWKVAEANGTFGAIVRTLPCQLSDWTRLLPCAGRLI